MTGTICGVEFTQEEIEILLDGTIDDALRILINIKKAVRKNLNLCGHCQFEIPTCASTADFVEYGIAPSGDNIIKCTKFKLDKEEKLLCHEFGCNGAIKINQDGIEECTKCNTLFPIKEDN